MGQPIKYTLDGTDFFITPLPAIEAFKIKTLLIQKLAPLAGGTIDTFLGILKSNKQNAESILDKDLNTEQIGKAFEKLLLQLDPDDLLLLVKRLLKTTICTYKNEDKILNLQFDESNFESSFNIVFSQRLMNVYQLLFEIIKINYNDFFVKMEGIGNRLKTITSEIIAPNSEKSLKKSGK